MFRFTQVPHLPLDVEGNKRCNSHSLLARMYMATTKTVAKETGERPGGP